jgi:hypothetical protein
VNPYDEAVAYAGGYWQPTEAGDDDALDRALQLAAMASTGRQLFQQQQAFYFSWIIQ